MANTLRVERFPSGAVYGYTLPNVQRMMLSGAFPEPIVPLVRQFVSSKLDTDKEQTDEEIEQWEEFKSRLVAWMVRTEGGKVTGEGRETECSDPGKAVTYTWEQIADPDTFPADDLAALFARAIRVVGSPKATKAPS